MAWFSNRGQVIQLAVAVIGVFVAVVKALPDLKNSQLFSAGAFNLYLLIALVLITIFNIYKLASYHPITTEVDKSTKEPDIVSLQTVKIESTNLQNIVYKNKMRCVFKNVSKSTIKVHRAAWVTTKDGAGTQSPFAAKFQREKDLGSWQKHDWNEQELEDEIELPPDWSFRVWVGLDLNATNAWLENKKNVKQLGTLLLPITIGERKYKVEIPV